MLFLDLNRLISYYHDNISDLYSIRTQISVGFQLGINRFLLQNLRKLLPWTFYYLCNKILLKAINANLLKYIKRTVSTFSRQHFIWIASQINAYQNI